MAFEVVVAALAVEAVVTAESCDEVRAGAAEEDVGSWSTEHAVLTLAAVGDDTQRGALVDPVVAPTAVDLVVPRIGEQVVAAIVVSAAVRLGVAPDLVIPSAGPDEVRAEAPPR